METDTSRTATNRVISDYPSLLVVAVVLPGVIVFVDQLAINASHTVRGNPVLLPLLFVVQVGILGFCTGRYVNNLFLRCVVFAWSIVLVDSVALTTMFYGQGNTAQCMTFAFGSGQVGLLTIWGILGRMPWPWRIPIFLVLLASVVMVLIRSPDHTGAWRSDFGLWAVILAMQSGMMVVLCWILRVAGYRLLPLATGSHNASDIEKEQFQFAIKHLIVWTTAVCPLLVLAKGIDWLLVDSQELFRTIVLGLALAIVAWTAMLSALGSGSRWIRLLMLICVVPMVGASLKWFTSRWIVTWNSTQSAWFFRGFQELGWNWISWTVLAAWFLASLLLVFRAGGYRLTRVRNRG